MRSLYRRSLSLPKTLRQAGGTILFLVAATFLIITIIIVAMLAANGLLSNRQNVQTEAESFALGTALKLNKQDNAGRVNILTAHSREGVYESRQNLLQANASYPTLGGMAAKLLEESRHSAQILEKERESLGAHIVTEVTEDAKKFNDNGRKRTTQFVGGQVAAPQVYDLEVGDIEGLPSNIVASTGNQSLARYDDHQGYLETKSGLYKSNINLKLPLEDADLNFELPALPSRQHQLAGSKTASKEALAYAPPAALYPSKSFKRTAYIYKEGTKANVRSAKIPSAIRCVVSSKVDVQTTIQSSGKILLDTAAATNGTNPEL